MEYSDITQDLNPTEYDCSALIRTDAAVTHE